MELKVGCNGRQNIPVVYKNKQIYIEGKLVNLDTVTLREGKEHVLQNGKSYQVEWEEEVSSGLITIRVNGNPYRVQIKSSLQSLLEQLGMSETQIKPIEQIKAPMPGLILKILVKKGDMVKASDPIVILEAMKMENSIKAGSASTIAEILVNTGQKVEKGQSLVIFE